MQVNQDGNQSGENLGDGKSIRHEQTSIFVKQMLEVNVSPNISQHIIMTTEDRLKLCLTETLKKAERKHDWIAPLGLLIAVITAFVTASFKDYILSAKTWEAVFVMVGLGSIIWLIISIRYAFIKIDIDDIINELKTNQKP
jgi:hypothetical protein